MADPWVLFATVAGAHALGVASPGPDFAVVVRQTLRAGRRAGIATALGIGSGILFHVGYSLWLELAAAALARTDDGSALWRCGPACSTLGSPHCCRGRRHRPPSMALPPYRWAAATGSASPPICSTPRRCCFLSPCRRRSSPRPPPYSLRVLLGVWLCAATAAWFSLVALTLGHSAVRAQLIRIGPMLDRAMGVLFIVLALVVLGFWPRS